MSTPHYTVLKKTTSVPALLNICILIQNPCIKSVSLGFVCVHSRMFQAWLTMYNIHVSWSNLFHVRLTQGNSIYATMSYIQMHGLKW